MSSSDLEQIEIPDMDDLGLLADTQNQSPSIFNETELAETHSHVPDRSQSLNPVEEEEKPTTEYALHILFTRFVRFTERKLALLQSIPEDSFESILGEGADPEFDMILESLGHVARRRPKPVIDSIMYWRKTKRDQPSVSLASLYVLCRALMEVIRQTPHDVLGSKLSEKLEEIVFKQLVSADPEVVVYSTLRGANWRYLARLLGEMSSFRLASVNDFFIAELEKKETSKRHEVKVSLLLEAMQYLKIKLYPEEYLEESSSFLESLSKFYRNTPISSPLRNQYAKALSYILEPLAESITVEVNQPSWATTMENLFKDSQKRSHNVGLAVRTASISGNQSQDSSSSSSAFSLSVMSLCLSPQPMFLENWLNILEHGIQKCKAKPLKAVNLLPAAARLAWVYIFRCSESLNLTTKKIETLKRMFLTSTNPKYWQAISADKNLRESCISLLRSCFQGYQQYTLDELLFPMLVGTDATSLAQHHAIAYDSAVLPDRAGIAVNAFVEVTKDLKSGIRPSFPSSRINDKPIQNSADRLSGAKESSNNTELPHQPSISSALRASFDLFGNCIGQISQWLEQGGTVSELSSRQNSVSHLVSLASGNNNASLNQSYENQCNESGIKTTEHHLLLLFIRSWPSWWTAEKHLRHLDALCKCVGNRVPAIRIAAAESFRKIAEVSDIKAILTPFTKAMMAVDIKNTQEALPETNSGSGAGSAYSARTGESGSLGGHGHSSSFSLGNSSSIGLGLGLGLSNSSSINADADTSISPSPVAKEMYIQGHSALNHLMLYVEIIEIWISRLQNGDSSISGSILDTQMLNLWSVVEEIEGNGLYFLCSQDLQIRPLGLRVLWLTTTMDQAVINYQASQQSEKLETKPSRIIDLLQKTPISQALSEFGKRLDLSTPERNRLSKFKSKRASLARIAESSYGVDSALWLKLFPFVINLCFETHPIPVALCRNLVSDRLVQMHEVISDLAAQPGSNLSSITSVSVIKQWKIYLIVACATLTSTEEQKLFVPPSPPNSSSGISNMHARKRSHQKITLHHQRITSARSVFRIVSPILRSEKNAIREAVVSGLSCTNVNTYKTLLECLQPVLSGGIQKIYQIQFGQLKTNAGVGESYLRSVTGVTQILRQTSAFLQLKDVRQDIWIRTEVVSVLQQLRELLGSIQSSQMAPLRNSFCELLTDSYSALKPSLVFAGRNPADEWLLFYKTVEMWSPFGSNAAAVLEHRASLKRRAANDVVLAQLEIISRDLDRASSRAIAALFIESQGFVQDVLGASRWIYALLGSGFDANTQEIGRVALENLLRSHASRTELLDEVVSKCYHNSSERSRGIAKVYFVALVNMLESHKTLSQSDVKKPQQFLALALFKIGDPDCETRFRAVTLIEIVENGLYGSSLIANEYQFRLRSSSSSVYKREIFVLSGKLANERRDETFYLFSQMTRAFQEVNDSDRKDILSVLLPWIQNIEFKPDDDLGLQMVLANLLEITTVFSGRMQHEVEALWVALCTSNSGVNGNALRILDFLLSFCLKYRTVGSVSVSRTVLIYLLASPASGAITEKLLSYLQPSFLITQGGKQSEALVGRACFEAFPYVASLSEIVSRANEKESSGKNLSLPPFSYGQLALVFLVDTISTPTPVLPKLPSLIHACIVLGDHFVALVQDKTRELLLNLAGMFNPEPVAMQNLTDLLGSLRWRYEDDGGAVPDQMSELISAILSHLSSVDILDEREWAQTAIHWATTSPVRHIACRSLQTYRCLNLHLDTKMLGDLLARLSSTISEQAVDIQGFASQILITINSAIERSDSNELLRQPALFWSAVAALSTANEREYSEALSAINKILSKWNTSMASEMLTNFPKRWDVPLDKFQGLLYFALRGLRSSETCELSHEVLNQLIILSENLSQSDQLILFGNKNPLPQLLAASLPWLLHAMDQPHLITSLAYPMTVLQRLVEPFSQSISRILDSFVKRRLWSRLDFLRQYTLALPVAFPSGGLEIMILLLSMVDNAEHFVRNAALDVLKTLIPELDIHQAVAADQWQGADLIAPLLRLLTTPDVEESLSVLDIIASVKPNKMDKDVLRMTLGSRQLMHEYENTETLFGIPDEAGWSVPSPAQAASTTRMNIHAVFYSCVSENKLLVDEELLDEPIGRTGYEFQMDEYAPQTNLYRENSQHQGSESMDKIITDLDEFDSFFTRVASPTQKMATRGGNGNFARNSFGRSQMIRNSDTRSPVGPVSVIQNNSSGNDTVSSIRQLPNEVRRRSTSESDSIPQLYDKKVSLILNRSLARTPSQVSFRTSFGDSFGRTNQSQYGSSSQITSPAASSVALPSSSLSTRPAHHRQLSSQARTTHNMSVSSFQSTGTTRSHQSTGSSATLADYDNVFGGISSLNSTIPRSPPARDPSPRSSIYGQPYSSFSPYGPSEGIQQDLQRSSSISPRNSSHRRRDQPPLDSIDFFSFEDVSPVESPSPSEKKSRKGPKTQDSSFRLESLLRGKRKNHKPDKSKQPSANSVNDRSPPAQNFQFPPR